MALYVDTDGRHNLEVAELVDGVGDFVMWGSYLYINEQICSYMIFIATLIYSNHNAAWLHVRMYLNYLMKLANSYSIQTHA